MNEASKKAPDGPGVYVWYCCLCIGKADIQNDENLLGLLSTYTAKFGRQQMSVVTSLNFDLSWRGHISPNADSEKMGMLTGQGLSEMSRQLISNMLETSGPIFYQPLYIGKAERSIRSRLNQHISEFVRLKELISKSSQVDYIGEDDFAQRAVTLGYSEDQLVVHTLEVPDSSKLPQEEVKKIVSIVEMYLNKWSTPLLGRR